MHPVASAFQFDDLHGYFAGSLDCVGIIPLSIYNVISRSMAYSHLLGNLTATETLNGKLPHFVDLKI